VRLRFRVRKPSFQKRFAARRSGLPGGKRWWRHRVGLKMPRGTGWVTNPRRFAYNWLYRRTTIDLTRPIRSLTRRRPVAPASAVAVLAVVAFVAVVAGMLPGILAAAMIAAIAVVVAIALTLFVAFVAPGTRLSILKARDSAVALARRRTIAISGPADEADKSPR